MSIAYGVLEIVALICAVIAALAHEWAATAMFWGMAVYMQNGRMYDADPDVKE